MTTGAFERETDHAFQRKGLGRGGNRTSRLTLLKNPSTRFWLLVWPRGDCWEWRGTFHPNGYGMFFEGCGTKNKYKAHRFAYFDVKGPMTPGLVLDHRCNHPWCVKPSHLVEVTVRANTRRSLGMNMADAAAQKCRNGHDDWFLNSKGYRECRTCKKAYDAYYHKHGRSPYPKGRWA